MNGLKIKALAPWFGGKRMLAPKIVEQLGRHQQYFEPFCGSMAVLFAKDPSGKETVNDLHGLLICLARVVADPIYGPRLYDRLSTTLFSESFLKVSQEFLTDLGDYYSPPAEVDSVMLEIAYYYFLASWMCRNGCAGTARMNYQLAVRWTNNGGSPTVRFRNAIESIPAWHERLRNVVILQRDSLVILERVEDSPDTAIYVDPPYCPETVNTNNFYLHDFSHHRGNLFDQPGASERLMTDPHTALASRLRRFKCTRIVVSYYDCPRVRRLYDGWTFIDCTMRKNLQNQNARDRRGEKIAPEILIVNGPIY